MSSCSLKAPKLDGVDKIVITYFNKSDSLSYTDTSSETIKLFKEIFNYKSAVNSCSPSGTIKFMSKNKIDIEVNFAFHGECQYFFMRDEAWKLTYRTGMYLDWVIGELKKPNEQNN